MPCIGPYSGSHTARLTPYDIDGKENKYKLWAFALSVAWYEFSGWPLGVLPVSTQNKNKGKRKPRNIPRHISVLHRRCMLCTRTSALCDGTKQKRICVVFFFVFCKAVALCDGCYLAVFAMQRDGYYVLYSGRKPDKVIFTANAVEGSSSDSYSMVVACRTSDISSEFQMPVFCLYLAHLDI